MDEHTTRLGLQDVSFFNSKNEKIYKFCSIDLGTPEGDRWNVLPTFFDADYGSFAFNQGKWWLVEPRFLALSCILPTVQLTDNRCPQSSWWHVRTLTSVWHSTKWTGLHRDNPWGHCHQVNMVNTDMRNRDDNPNDERWQVSTLENFRMLPTTFTASVVSWLSFAICQAIQAEYTGKLPCKHEPWFVARQYLFLHLAALGKFNPLSSYLNSQPDISVFRSAMYLASYSNSVIHRWRMPGLFKRRGYKHEEQFHLLTTHNGRYLGSQNMPGTLMGVAFEVFLTVTFQPHYSRNRSTTQRFKGPSYSNARRFQWPHNDINLESIHLCVLTRRRRFYWYFPRTVCELKLCVVSPPP